MISYSVAGDTITFKVRAQPRASKSVLAGELDGALKVRLAAPPVDGAANDELIALFSAKFGVGKREVEILSGSTGRMKLVRLHGISENTFLSALEL